MKFTRYKFDRITYKGKTVLYQRIANTPSGNPKYQILVLKQHGADEFNNVVTYSIKDAIELLFKEYYKK